MENAWDIMETYFWDEKNGIYMVSYISLTQRNSTSYNFCVILDNISKSWHFI